ncbi:MAG TPA: hypothetical protein VGJ44_08695, partial [Kribbellaceae bacterium]
MTDELTDLDDRARRALVALADAVPTHPDLDAVVARARGERPAAAPRGRSDRRPSGLFRQRPGGLFRALAPTMAAAAVVGLIGTAALLPRIGGAPAHVSAPADAAPVLPKRLPDHSWLTAGVSDAPPGRAIALYIHGRGVELTDNPQAVVLGADGRTVRRVDLAEARGTDMGALTSSEVAPMLLAPDGSAVAVGDLRTTVAASLAIVDLRTGRTRRYALGDFHSVYPLAWSPDLRYLAYADGADTLYQPGGARRPAPLFLLDVKTGRRSTLPGYERVSALAFSPDSRRMAMQDGPYIRIVGIDGREERRLDLPDHFRLAGSAAWSPDGAWVTISSWRAYEADASELRFLDPTGASRPAPAPIKDAGPVVGWRSNRALIVFDELKLAFDQRTLDGGRRRLAAFDPHQIGNAEPWSMQLAANLVPELRVA